MLTQVKRRTAFGLIEDRKNPSRFYPREGEKGFSFTLSTRLKEGDFACPLTTK
jgi:hypothetical protein